MRQSIRKQLFVMRVYVLTSSLVFIVLAAAAFRQATLPKSMGDLLVSPTWKAHRRFRPQGFPPVRVRRLRCSPARPRPGGPSC